MVLSYAAAFFFVVVAIAAAYALFKAGGTLQRVDTVLGDVDREAVPLLQKAGTTLDGVNANLGNVDQITKDVADITDKIDNTGHRGRGRRQHPGAQGGFVQRRRPGRRHELHAARQDRAAGQRVAPRGGAAPGGAWSAPSSAPASDAAARGRRRRRRTPPAPHPRPRTRRRPPRGRRRRCRGRGGRRDGDRREGLRWGCPPSSS